MINWYYFPSFSIDLCPTVCSTIHLQTFAIHLSFFRLQPQVIKGWTRVDFDAGCCLHNLHTNTSTTHMVESPFFSEVHWTRRPKLKLKRWCLFVYCSSLQSTATKLHFSCQLWTKGVDAEWIYCERRIFLVEKIYLSPKNALHRFKAWNRQLND